MGDLLERLRERAESYRLGGPSAEHTASMLDLAAAEIEKLRRGGEETFKLALMHQSRATAAEAKVAEMQEALRKCADILDANDFGADVRFEARALSDGGAHG